MNPQDRKPEHPGQLSGREAEMDAGLSNELEGIRAALEESAPDGPPELVDQAVMNMARRHIEAPSRRRLRWIGAFATASIVVVAMFLVVRQDAEHALPQPDQQDGYKLEALEQRRSADPPAPQAATSAQKSRLRSAQPARADQAAEAEATIGEFASEPTDTAAEAPTAEQMTADRWIERLIRLKEDGDAERFEHELAAFRKAYPDHPLPAVLSE